MGELARSDSSRQLVQDAARTILARPGGRLMFPYNLRRWLLERWHEEPDPYGVEMIAAPEYQLERLAARGRLFGDCDDVATLGAALALAAGFEARYIAVSFWPGGVPEHVWAEVLDGMSWVDLDTLRPAGPLPEVGTEIIYRL